MSHSLFEQPERAPQDPPAPAAAPKEAARGPMARREFRLYFAGNLISNVGTWLQNVALGVYMLDLTHSSYWVGLAGSALFLPALLFALPAGVLADRTDRLRLLRRSQLAAGTLAGVLTALAALGAASRMSVVLLAAGLGLSVAVAIPAMQAMLPSLVPPEELPEAIGLNALTFNLARVIGPALAAATLTALGAVWAFGLNALSFVALAVALTLIGRPPFPRAGGSPGPMREGIAYAWRHRRTRAMLLAITAVSTSLDPITTLSPALARSYGIATGGAGWIVSAWGAGAVLGIVALRRLPAGRGRWVGRGGLVALAAGILGLGAARSLAGAVGAGLVAGIGYISATVVFTTVVQAEVPEKLRGRVSALWTLAFLGPRTFSAVLDGALADLAGPHLAAAAFAIPAVVAALLVRNVSAPSARPARPPEAPP